MVALRTFSAALKGFAKLVLPFPKRKVTHIHEPKEQKEKKKDGRPREGKQQQRYSCVETCQ